MPRLVLCDDHPVFVDALATVLGRHGFVIEEIVTRPSDLLPAVGRHRPDACVIDRHLGDHDGLDLIGPARAASPSTRVLLLTADRDERTARRALLAGAAGYLCKTAGVGAVVNALRAIAAGVAPARVAPDPGVLLSAADADAHRLAGYLTGREWECLALLVDGCGTTAIAARLGVSATTARTHVQAVLTKLGVHSRLEAASLAVRHSLFARSG